MKKRLFPILMSLMLILTIWPSMVYAEDDPVFSLEITVIDPKDSDQVVISDADLKIGDQVEVIVNGQHIEDVYGYELRLSYPPDRLRFVDASTSWEGFSVPPIVEDGEIILAHTKVGNVKGESGDVPLAKLQFEAIKQGVVSIGLTQVKLVDSQVDSITNEPNISQAMVITPLFSDIAGHWAEKDILRAAAMGWINGYPDGRFGPQDKVTRAQFTTMLSRALSLADQAGPEVDFIDAAEIPEFARSHVSRATSAGIIKGFTDQTFRPQQLITRSEITVMIMRATQYDEEDYIGRILPYRDADQVADWAYPAVVSATKLGLIRGVGDDRFAPHGITSRAEAVTLIIRLLDHLAPDDEPASS